MEDAASRRALCSLLRHCGRIALSHCDLAVGVRVQRIQLPGFYRTNRDRRRTRDRGASVHAEAYPQQEIGMRLYEIPAFRTFAEEIGIEIAREMAPNLNH